MQLGHFRFGAPLQWGDYLAAISAVHVSGELLRPVLRARAGGGPKGAKEASKKSKQATQSTNWPQLFQRNINNNNNNNNNDDANVSVRLALACTRRPQFGPIKTETRAKWTTKNKTNPERRKTNKTHTHKRPHSRFLLERSCFGTLFGKPKTKTKKQQKTKL